MGTCPRESVAVFPVRLLGPVAMDVVVGYTTVSGTAGTADYAAQSRGTLTIAACEDIASRRRLRDHRDHVEVRTLHDMLAEGRRDVQRQAVAVRDNLPT